MRRITGRSTTLLAAAAALACAVPLAAQADTTAHPPAPRRHDYISACPGQEQAMVAVLQRPQVRRRSHVIPEVYRVEMRRVVRPLGSSPGPTADNPGTRIAFARDMEVRLQVDGEGRVQQVEVLQGTGDLRMDQSMVDRLRDQRFDPATESAFPVPGCAIQKVMLRG